MKSAILLPIKDELTLLIKRALSSLASELGLEQGLNWQKLLVSGVFIETIRQERLEALGDYACTVSMDRKCRQFYAQARPEFKNPHKLAQAILQVLQRDKKAKQLLAGAELSGAGFINLRLQSQVLWEYLIQLGEKQEALLRLQDEQTHRIIFEFVSANPTGPLNVVSARAAALGDVCCNMLEVIGHKVIREYYVNDYGNQVQLLGESGLLRYLESHGCQLKFAEQKSDGIYEYPKTLGLPFPKQGYQGEYVKDVVKEIAKQSPGILPSQQQILDLQQKAHQNDLSENFLQNENLVLVCQKFGSAIVSFILEQQQKTLQGFRVRFDNYFRESSLHHDNQVLVIQKQLEHAIYKQDNTIFFRSSQYADDKDRVIVRADGRPTYFLADIAYHANKMKRGFTHIYNIWGPDHHGYIQRLQGAMQALGYSGALQVLIAQQVNLLEDGQALGMSKRSGRLVTLSELMQEVPVDVLRYFFIMRSFAAPMDFDLTVAKDTSEKNPYYYAAYAHARICSIFRKAREKILLQQKEKN